MKIKTNKTKPKQNETIPMYSLRYSATPEHGASPGVWWIYTVSLHWRKHFPFASGCVSHR